MATVANVYMFFDWLLNFAEEKDIEQPVLKHIDIDHCCNDAVNLRSMTQCFEIERTFSRCILYEKSVFNQPRSISEKNYVQSSQ